MKNMQDKSTGVYWY